MDTAMTWAAVGGSVNLDKDTHTDTHRGKIQLSPNTVPLELSEVC